jgi:hypothetical protein
MAKKAGAQVWVLDPKLIAEVHDACLRITPREFGASIVVSKKRRQRA